MVQPGFTDAKKHIQALVSGYAMKHPGADPAGRDLLLARQLLDPKEAVCQTIMLPMGANTSSPEKSSNLFVNEEPGMWCTVGACSTRPLSRGHVHISSSDPTVQPTIDPAYYKHPLDLDVIARSVLHVIDLAQVNLSDLCFATTRMERCFCIRLAAADFPRRWKRRRILWRTTA